MAPIRNCSADSIFEEHALISRNGAYYCPECHESYASVTDVALAAINSLRDALDDAAYLESLVRGVEETFGVSRQGRTARPRNLAVGFALDFLTGRHYMKREPRFLLEQKTGVGTARFAPPCMVAESVLVFDPVSVCV